MGVPAFFRWLSRKYPSVIIECVENKIEGPDGKWVPEDASLPNPNGIEFDNLYLDMNGIIHPCTHPEDKPAPKNEDEMMVAIFECIDRLFNIVRPRKVLYMAIDGVAPRAKMNQQRSRRFRASKETAEKQLEVSRIKEKLLSVGAIVPPEKPKGEHFDSNCITPGTPFMDRLSKCLHYYVHDRLNNNPAWKGLKVFLSDASVPGEGEHKIMDFIRRQRGQPNHDPNTQHVLCGADADLIMLGLATHEPNFTIIREEFLPNKPRPCEVCGSTSHEMSSCEGLMPATMNETAAAAASEVKFIFVRLSVLKEYLRRTLQMPNLPFQYDFERVLDDWVFLCFFVGNDFLPHLPSLEIREGAIDRLINLYKNCVYKTSGYLTNSGEVNLERVQMILRDLGMVEDDIFTQRQKREIQFRERNKANKKRKPDTPNFQNMHNSQFAPTQLGKGIKPQSISNIRNEIANIRRQDLQNDQKSELEKFLEPNDGSASQAAKPSGSRKRKHDDAEDNEGADETTKLEAEEAEEEDPDANDEVRLWEAGFKDRYYESKFDVGPDNLQFRYSVALQYVRGLCWVLKYYYQGCASWNWYFPYHYAPFASDFIHIAGLSTQFEKNTKPFNPLEQLMGVFPAASSVHVPRPWATLMSDPESTIIDFYPEDFKIDLNGKKFAWQGVALLPFVDEKRLIKALEPYYKLLTPEEVKRNQRGEDRLYVGPANKGYSQITTLYKKKTDPKKETTICIDGVQGMVLLSEENVSIEDTLESPIYGLDDVYNNKVVTICFRDPKYADGFIFEAKKLPGAIDPPNVLAPESRPSNYRPQIGFNRNFPQASLGDAGHRMVNHYSGGYKQQQQHNNDNRNFATIAPPNSYNRHNDSGGYNPQRGHGNNSNYQQNRQGGYQNNFNNYSNQGNNQPYHRQNQQGNFQQQNRNNRFQPYQQRPNNNYGQGGNNGGGFNRNQQGNRGGGGGSGGNNNSGGGYWR
ncbi:5'-3' exoribonuclease 2 homolog isoform X2 [Sitodiplosis mosellana]|uniref:5'-3' exoribonuclease 2 homolog isoform X2 n=1 Tax=Sitodiplosis mosellana TaxID=263140 RepID=UPI002443E042|nr:5'-3' exoribonuclease 2 homolog isoform X2 [Sitodiplosis mosellana]